MNVSYEQHDEAASTTAVRRRRSDKVDNARVALSLNTHLGPDDALDGRRARPVDETVPRQRVRHLALLGQPEVTLGGGAVEAAGQAVVPRDMQVDRHGLSRGGLHPSGGSLRALGQYRLALMSSAFLHHVLWTQGTKQQLRPMK